MCLFTGSHRKAILSERYGCVSFSSTRIRWSRILEYARGIFQTQTQAITLRGTWANGLPLPRRKASLEPNVPSRERLGSNCLLCWKLHYDCSISPRQPQISFVPTLLHVESFLVLRYMRRIDINGISRLRAKYKHSQVYHWTPYCKCSDTIRDVLQIWRHVQLSFWSTLCATGLLRIKEMRTEQVIN